MVKVILQVYPMLRAADEEERAALRPIGRNVARYQEAVRGLHVIVQAADDLGIWGVAPIEHVVDERHLASQVVEVTPPSLTIEEDPQRPPRP